MYLPCQRSLQSLSPHTVDGQFVWRTGWEGENIIDLVYVDLWLHLELVNWLFLEVDWSGETTTGGTIYHEKLSSTYWTISTSFIWKRKETLRNKKKKQKQLVEKMMKQTSTRKKHPKCVSPFPWYQQRGFLRFCWWNYSMVSTPPTLPPYRTTVDAPTLFGHGRQHALGMASIPLVENSDGTKGLRGWKASKNQHRIMVGFYPKMFGEKKWMGSIPIYGISDHIRPVCKQKIP